MKIPETRRSTMTAKSPIRPAPGTTRSFAIAVLLFSLLAAACASTGSGSRSSGNRNLITLEELQGEPSGTMFDAIRRLRPRWLQNRGLSSTRSTQPSPPQVYVDGAPTGSIGILRSLSVQDVQEAEYMNASDATTRFGTGHDGGAILIRTRSGG